MFKKVLIANRGEITCRVIRTLKKMDIKSVVIYSDADNAALHVKESDEAVYVGHSPANESYLNIPKIIEAIDKTGADAVHPGYGFLSENAEFARILKKKKITFIGPSVEAIELMGDKINAKQIAKEAGVSTIPGYMGVIKDSKEAKKIAKKIGFPVMIKAAAGGGGKGMRVVYSEKEVAQAFESTTNEANNNFRDGRIFIEKYIEDPRHIEIQILADQFGKIICLGERECSIQRHHQKIIEEAPSVFLDEKTRNLMYKQSVALAKKVKYYSAGTIEFIMDKNKNFYFLEMNTRLQVEHCVTELTTGIDLVEQMLNIANKKKLSLAQKDVKINGWAIESRIYAEDPTCSFLPSSGRISEYKEPTHDGKNVRIDSGVYEGSEVSMFYDPMISKLCTYGATRDDAINKMKEVLGSYVIRGISTNISFLQDIINNQKFIDGKITTNFIAEEYPHGFTGSEITTERGEVFLAATLLIYLNDALRAKTISGQIPNLERQIGTRWVVYLGDEVFSVNVNSCQNGYDIYLDTKIINIRSNWILGNTLLQGTVNNKEISVQIEIGDGGYRLTYGGSTIDTAVRTPRAAELNKFIKNNNHDNDNNILEAPISGKIIQVKVNEGEEIQKHQDLVIIEAMKMENIIKSDKDSKIKKINIEEGQNIQTGHVMIEFEN
ncbi:MAG: acetyl-CoA carboxylase biotin carboxylase subunit [Pseudomonadota bacterium]